MTVPTDYETGPVFDGQKPDDIAKEEKLPLILGTLQQNEPIAPAQSSQNASDRKLHCSEIESVQSPPVPHPNTDESQENAKVAKVVNELLQDREEPTKHSFEAAVRAQLGPDSKRASIIQLDKERAGKTEDTKSSASGTLLKAIDLVLPSTCGVIVCIFVVLFFAIFITLERRLARGEFAAQDFTDF
eukprot:Selendium_serpulae@DN1617_c0_g1_i1.p1